MTPVAIPASRATELPSLVLLLPRLFEPVGSESAPDGAVEGAIDIEGLTAGANVRVGVFSAGLSVVALGADDDATFGGEAVAVELIGKSVGESVGAGLSGETDGINVSPD